MNGDLTFSNLKIYNNISERVEKGKESSENIANSCTSDRNLNGMNLNRYNNPSETFSDPNDIPIKSKNGMINYQDNNAVNGSYNYQEEDNFKSENQIENAAINHMSLNNKNNKLNSDNMDFQALNIKLNFSKISYEEIHKKEGEGKRSKRKSSSMDFENENNLIQNNQHNSKNKSGIVENLNKYNEISRNSNDFIYGSVSKGKNTQQEYEDSDYAKSIIKMRRGEINNPLIIKKYEIKNLEKGNLLKMPKGKIAYMPFQKSFNIEKIHFNFSDKSSHLSNTDNVNYFNSTGRISKNNFNLRKTHG
jgi:hypothetical protein